MTTHVLIRSLMLLLSFLFTITIYSQKSEEQVKVAKEKILQDPKVSKVIFSEERQTPSMITFKTGAKSYPKDNASSLLMKYLAVRTGTDGLQVSRQSSLFNSFEVIEFQQYFKGVKVEYAHFKALVKEGNILFFNGTWYDVPATLKMAATLTKDQSLQKAKARINAKKYAIDFFRDEINKTTDARVKKALEKEMEAVSPKGELVVVKDFNKKGTAEMRLAYKFDIYATEPMSRSWVYVDAANGSILLIDPIIKHVNPNPPSSVNTTVQTRYAGARNIYVKQISGNDPNNGLPLLSSHPATEIYIPGTSTWVLIDDTRGKGIETYDLNGVGGVPFSVGAFYTQGKSFTDVDNNWSIFEHKRSDPLGLGIGQDGPFELENDDIAWDAHWGAEMVYDYWLAKHNRKSYDDRDAKIKNFLHFGPAYDNAFWNGTAMTYGDGSGPLAQGFKALTALDVCAHEIGHGICSYTADLVYEKESGAMNEAFSDIWAACVERFVVASVDPSLANTYRPFYIGEQIGATADQPLRRMDNPKVTSDPDTYGGEFWQPTDCVPDQLLNDYCGVHTNSGLLNKWFYLMTVGSQNGSGPDASYARPDSDDGVNDLGNNYNVTGLGFTVSEQIAYLTELMLTATATYAEARDVSIVNALAFSGDACGNVVRTVTDAWYAVGVGSQFNPACVSTYGFIYQPGATVSEGGIAAGCTGEKLVNVPVLMPANSTATITAAGNAASNIDYRLGSSTLSNPSSSNAVMNAVIYIKYDAIIESNETINLSVSVSNAGASPVNTTYAITISDDDIEPVIGAGVISLLGGGNFDGQPDGYNSPAGWTEVTEVPGENLWGVWGGQLRITGAVQGIQLQPGQYNSLSATSTIIAGPQVDARGLSNIKIKFDFRVQGEVDANGADPNAFGVFDYMTVVYSFDGVNYSEMRILDEQFRAFCSLTPSQGTFEATLPAVFNNSIFYIGFKWSNDDNAGGPESVSIDNLTLVASPRIIENDLNHNSRENLSAGLEPYFYSTQDGQLLGKIKNNSTKDFGCTNVYIERAGNGAFNLYQNRTALHKVADKVTRIETSFIYKVSTTVRLYFTEQQLTALEAATNQPRSAFRVYHVNAASYTQAANNNTDVLVPAYTALPGAGGYFTVTFNEKANGSYALGCQVSVLGLQSAGSNVEIETLAPNWKFGNIYPNPGNENVYILVNAPQQQKVSVELINNIGQVVNKSDETLIKGANQLKINISRFSSGAYRIRVRSEQEILNTQSLLKE